MNIKKINESEIKEALDLVWKVFIKYESPDYSEKGIEEFKRSINDKSWIEKREFYGAFDDNNNIVGVIATKDKSHIALFFVDGNYQGQGIGRKLFEKIKHNNSSEYITVNSSPYAHDIYKHFGFIDTDKKQCINGLVYYPMIYDQGITKKQK